MLRCSLGALVVALVLFALGFGLTSSTLERRVVLDADAAVVTAPAATVVAAASSNVKVAAAVVTTSWSLVAIDVVIIVAALMAFVASARRTGSSWLRAPPVPAA